MAFPALTCDILAFSPSPPPLLILLASQKPFLRSKDIRSSRSLALHGAPGSGHFPLTGSRHQLYFSGYAFLKKGTDYETHVPAEHAQARQVPWLSCPHVHQGRPCRPCSSSCKGPQAPDCVTSLETIASSSEISELFAHGRRESTPYLTFVFKRRRGSLDVEPEQHDLHGRVAFIAGKKLGNAVWRNRARRRMRAICQEIGGPWPGLDVIFLARKALTQASYSKVLSACQKASRRFASEERACEDS